MGPAGLRGRLRRGRGRGDRRGGQQHPEANQAIGEAEWNLDTLESLFDYYFVQPAAIKAKRDALDRKLAVNRNPQLRAI